MTSIPVSLDRRGLLRFGCGTAALTLLPWPRAARAAAANPQFFMQIIIPNGMDVSYLFDARPLALTAAGLKSNYLRREPEEWRGSNGGRALATHLTAPLAPLKESFSVLNGVVMAAAFDGHDQNLNFIFCGNPFGGDAFLPWLNHGPAKRPLDFVSQGRIPAEISNGAAGIPLRPQAAASLAAQLKASGALDPAAPLMRHLRARFAANRSGVGRFAAGAAAMDDAAEFAPGLGSILADVKVPPTGRETLASALALTTEMMKRGATPSAVIILRPEGDDDLDTHDATSAGKSGEVIGSIASQLAQVIRHLHDTPFNETRSMFDVTTFAAVTEFSRTMRQTGMPIEGTGTDHNPLTNTVFIGGRGIKGGQVIGASDFQTADETLSAPHLAFDGDRLKIMGRPFDFATGRPFEGVVSDFKAERYLTFSSVVNTVMGLFSVDEKRQFLAERNGVVAPVLHQVLA